MVGILIISHSANVAAGTAEIARQMVGDQVPVAYCGGNSAGGIGTDPDAIAAALKTIYHEAGVIVLADLGSAVMSAELVLDTLIPERRKNVMIANAPLVEGAVLAAVEASIGKNLIEVVEAAELAGQMRKIERE